MDRILSTYSYGICLFSMEVLQDFLKKEKILKKTVDNPSVTCYYITRPQREGIS